MNGGLKNVLKNSNWGVGRNREIDIGRKTSHELSINSEVKKIIVLVLAIIK